MMDRSESAYHRWSRANELAKEREAELKRAWAEFFERRSLAPPSDELIAEAARVRATANELLHEAIRARNEQN